MTRTEMALLVAALCLAALAAVAALLVAAAVIRRRREPSCSWCSNRSGWPGRGHDTLHCRGYVQEVRERHPEYGGNLWRDPATDTTTAPTA